LYSYIYPHPGQINTTQNLGIHNFLQKLQKFFISDLHGARRVLMILAPLFLLLERAQSLLLLGFSSEMFFYACLLPPVAGVVSSTAGQFASSASAEFLLQLSMPLQQWSWEAVFLSTTSAAGDGCPTSKDPLDGFVA
jgi:hypothetical protein